MQFSSIAPVRASPQTLPFDTRKQETEESYGGFNQVSWQTTDLFLTVEHARLDEGANVKLQKIGQAVNHPLAGSSIFYCESFRHALMRDKRDRQKKRFIEALTAQGTVFHAAQAAGISRQTAYRWQRDDPEFADQWEEAHENAVDQVESTIYQQAIGGNTLAAIFYLKAHRPIYRDRLNIDIEQVNSEIKERMAQLRENPDLFARAIPALRD